MAEMNKHLKALELDKVLSMLASRACNDEAREAILALRPETETALAETLLRYTEDAYVLLAKFGAPTFADLKNVGNSCARAAAGGLLSMKELLEIAATARGIRAIREWRDRNGAGRLGIDVYFDALSPNKYLEEKIFSAILSEEEMSDNASPELASLRRKIKSQEASIRDQLDRMIRSQNYRTILQDAIITQRNGRYVVPVKNEYRGSVSGLVHDTSSSGATVFIEPAGVVEANNEIRVLHGKEAQEVERILYALSEEAGSFEQEICGSFENAVELNVIFCKAQLAYQMKASVPILNNEGIMELKKARHPLIDPKMVVATDIRLGFDFDTLVITGPNTGGKTVTIKTMGLLCAMAACGLMIPAADGSRVPVFCHLLADIGDEQSIEQSLSTFSSHMVNMVGILQTADKNSLVLADELGAGTDPVEGAALAMAILEELHKKGAKVAATTHYAELKAYALQTDRVENGSCEFDVNTLRPTYKLILGIPGRSNAFAISERLGMGRTVIDRARELVSTENVRFEDVVDRLEKSRLQMEGEKEEAEKVRAEAEKQRERAGEALTEAEARRDREIENARGQALKIVEQAKREANALLFQLDKLKKEARSSENAAELARRAKSTVNAHLSAIDAAIDPVMDGIDDGEDYVLPRPLEVGDDVFCKTIGRNAVVTETKDKKEMVEIAAGMLKLRVKEDTLRLLKKKEKKSSSPVRPLNSNGRAGMSVNNRCDLRGMTVDEALLTLDRFLDELTLSGLTECTIIHGKGTGALRSAVTDYLRSEPRIKSYRLGVYGEGENGVTIAELK